MEETARISKLFADLYNGTPWLEVTLVGTLEAISAEKAAEKKVATRNSIWEITNHLIAWRRNVLERVKGNTITTPQDNYIRPVNDTSDHAWKTTLEELDHSQKEWTDFLKNFSDNSLENIHPVNGITHYEHIHGIIQHDAYHLGQIVLLAKHP